MDVFMGGTIGHESELANCIKQKVSAPGAAATAFEDMTHIGPQCRIESYGPDSILIRSGASVRTTVPSKDIHATLRGIHRRMLRFLA